MKSGPLSAQEIREIRLLAKGGYANSKDTLRITEELVELREKQAKDCSEKKK